MFAPGNERRNEQAGDGAVGHAVPRVASSDVNIRGVVRIAPNETHSVDWPHHLPRPPLSHLERGGNALPGPRFEAGEAHLSIIRLPCPVILAAHDEHLAV